MSFLHENTGYINNISNTTIYLKSLFPDERKTIFPKYPLKNGIHIRKVREE